MISRIIRVGALVGLAWGVSGSLAPAQSNDRFDLHCETTATYDVGEGPVNPTASEFKARVDLGSGQFCTSTCQMIEQLGTPLTASQIDLSYEAHYDGQRLGDMVRVSLNRVTGSLLLRYGTLTERGQCRRLPFSGFPQTLF